MSDDIKDMDDVEAQVWGMAYANHGHALCLRDDERCRAVDFADEAGWHSGYEHGMEDSGK